jgi:hypothetical protein
MKAFPWIGSIKHVSQTVLIAQVFFNLGINLLNRLLAGNLKQPDRRFRATSVPEFLSVHARLLRISATSAWTAVMAAHSYSSKAAAEGTVFIILK